MVNIPLTSMMNELKLNVNDIDPMLMRTLKNIEWVSWVLTSHKAPRLKQFAICFYISEDCPRQVLNKCIDFALSRQIESFMLDFDYSRWVLDTNSFTNLPTRDHKFLKELRLEKLIVSGEVIELFLHNCPLLERLNLYYSDLTSNLVVSGSLIKYLEIVLGSEFENSIKVYAPNLIQLNYSCNFDWLFLSDVPNLVEASFEPHGPQNTIDQFATAAAKLEILTITLNKKNYGVSGP